MEAKERELAAILAIPRDALRRPHEPVAAFAQEAHRLRVCATHDRAMLEAAGLKWTLVDALPVRIAILRDAESRWTAARLAVRIDLSGGDAAAIGPMELRDRAFTHVKRVVDEIRGFARYAFRGDPARARAYTRQHRRTGPRRKPEPVEAREDQAPEPSYTARRALPTAVRPLKEFARDFDALRWRYSNLCVRSNAGERVDQDIRDTVAALDAMSSLLGAISRYENRERARRCEQPTTTTDPAGPSQHPVLPA